MPAGCYYSESVVSPMSTVAEMERHLVADHRAARRRYALVITELTQAPSGSFERQLFTVELAHQALERARHALDEFRKAHPRA